MVFISFEESFGEVDGLLKWNVTRLSSNYLENSYLIDLELEKSLFIRQTFFRDLVLILP
jgi:hypothetical protein